MTTRTNRKVVKFSLTMARRMATIATATFAIQACGGHKDLMARTTAANSAIVNYDCEFSRVDDSAPYPEKTMGTVSFPDRNSAEVNHPGYASKKLKIGMRCGGTLGYVPFQFYKKVFDNIEAFELCVEPVANQGAKRFKGWLKARVGKDGSGEKEFHVRCERNDSDDF